MSSRVAIVGVGQTTHTSKKLEVNEFEMVNEAVRAALEDAQLGISDIDAVVVGNMDFFEGHYLPDAIGADPLGAYMKSGLKMNTGGTVGSATVVAAWHHVASGIFNTVLAIGYEKHDIFSATSAMLTVLDPIYERSFNVGTLPGLASMAASYMDRSGAKEEHAAMVRVIQSEGASRNPYAHLRERLAIEDVLDSRMVAYPLRLLTLCPTSCGASALVMASEDRANKIARKPVWFADHVTVHRENYTSLLITEEGAETTHRVAARKLYKRNGITNPRKEIQMFEMYDPCSWNILEWSEEFMIFKEGESWKAVEDGVIGIEGEFPICPSGGVTCTNAIGSSGTQRVLEAALQIREEAGDHQVTRIVNKALASGFGGSLWTDLFLLQKEMPD